MTKVQALRNAQAILEESIRYLGHLSPSYTLASALYVREGCEACGSRLMRLISYMGSDETALSALRLAIAQAYSNAALADSAVRNATVSK